MHGIAIVVMLVPSLLEMIIQSIKKVNGRGPNQVYPLISVHALQNALGLLMGLFVGLS